MKARRNRAASINYCMMAAILVLSCLFCAPGNKISTIHDRVENLGIFGTSRNKSVIGQDGCTPIQVGNRMMWTFGDTIIGDWKGDVTVNATFEDTAVMKGMLSNSLAFTDIPSPRNIRGLDFTFYRENGAVAQFIKPSPGEDPSVWRFWAIDGIEMDGTVYVYYIHVFIDKNLSKKKNPGLPIRVMGVGIAEWKIPPGWEPGAPVSFKRTAKIFFEGEPVFGDAVIRRGDYLYLIGHGPASGNRVPAYVTRVPASAIRKRSSYEFLNADGRWVRTIRAASPIVDDVMGEPSLSYNDSMREYLVLYCSLDGKIKTVTFNDFATIMYKKTAVIYMPPSLPSIPARAHLSYYSGKEIFSSGQVVYAIYINPAIYQPILLKIPYQRFR